MLGFPDMRLLPASLFWKLGLVCARLNVLCMTRFASYRLAAIHDARRVAAELGHTSPQMLYSTYRELVLPEEAERCWKIAPQPAEARKIVTFSAS
jgi:hypothetical protein